MPIDLMKTPSMMKISYKITHEYCKKTHAKCCLWFLLKDIMWDVDSAEALEVFTSSNNEKPLISAEKIKRILELGTSEESAKDKKISNLGSVK